MRRRGWRSRERWWLLRPENAVAHFGRPSISDAHRFGGMVAQRAGESRCRTTSYDVIRLCLIRRRPIHSAITAQRFPFEAHFLGNQTFNLFGQVVVSKKRQLAPAFPYLVKHRPLISRRMLWLYGSACRRQSPRLIVDATHVSYASDIGRQHRMTMHEPGRPQQCPALWGPDRALCQHVSRIRFNPCPQGFGFCTARNQLGR